MALGFKFGILHVGPWYQTAALLYRVIPLAIVLVGSFAAYRARGPSFPRRLFALSSGMMLAWYGLRAVGLDNLVARVVFAGVLLLGSASWLTKRKHLKALEAESANRLGIAKLPAGDVGAV